jgi:prepilin-type N-terminal cleavage/methylation domain-containing protein
MLAERSSNLNRKTQAGFTLLELTVSVLVLVIVMGAIFKQVDGVQKTATTQAVKLDLTQEGREFVDQFSRDIHMAGYPISTVYSSTGGQTDAQVALGIVEASPTKIRFEGDVYGDGTVYSVVYNYFATDPNDSNCPCLRRSATKKLAADPVIGQTQPIYYTEVQNLIDPTGMAQGIFTYFDANGNPVDASGGLNITNNPTLIQLIDGVKVNLNTRTNQRDPQTGAQIVNSIASIAQLEN